MAKMDPKMIALCAAAVGIIYTTGYFVTEPTVVSLAQAAPSTVSVAQNVPSSSASPSSPSSSGTNPSGNNASNGGTAEATNGTSAGSSGASTAGQTSPYRDGTYYGQGSNRIGSVAVAVTISQGKISACEITSCNTHYSQSYIDPILPQEVVQLQSGNVDIVSGATRSSEDFAAAVQQALAQAQA